MNRGMRWDRTAWSVRWGRQDTPRGFNTRLPDAAPLHRQIQNLRRTRDLLMTRLLSCQVELASAVRMAHHAEPKR